MAKNSLKTKEKGKRSTKKTSSKKKRQDSSPFVEKVINFVKDERVHKIFGSLLLLASVYLFLAFTSYLFTWKADQSAVDGRSIWGAGNKQLGSRGG